MSLELVNTLATLGTFLVIAATAFAAIVQLRHMRDSNQIAALNELRETMETREFQDAQQFVMTELAEKLRDPAFRRELLDRSARTAETLPLIAKVTRIGNFFETMGMLVKARMIDRDIALDVLSGNVAQGWELLAPATAIIRRREGRALWDNFEYLTVLARSWNAAHPDGTYPAGVSRIDLKDEWLEADALDPHVKAT